MKKLLSATAALALVALTAPANAADLPVKAPPMVMPALYNWTGLYIGVEGGGVMGQQTDWYGFDPTTGLVNSPNVGHPMHGGFVGGEAGFNWQSGRWVFGIEGDGNWAEIEEAGICPNVAFSCISKIRDYETVRARIGYAFGPTGSFLVYITGGWATASQSLSAGLLTVLGVGGVPPVVNVWERHNGFAVGGGAEYGILPWLSLKAEALYINLDERDYCVAGCPFPLIVTLTATHLGRTDFIVARMGLNARFNWGKAPTPVVARY